MASQSNPNDATRDGKNFLEAKPIRSHNKYESFPVATTTSSSAFRLLAHYSPPVLCCHQLVTLLKLLIILFIALVVRIAGLPREEVESAVQFLKQVHDPESEFADHAIIGDLVDVHTTALRVLEWATAQTPRMFSILPAISPLSS